MASVPNPKRALYVVIAAILFIIAGFIALDIFFYGQMKKANLEFLKVKRLSEEMNKKRELLTPLTKEKEKIEGQKSEIEASFFKRGEDYELIRNLENLASTTRVSLKISGIEPIKLQNPAQSQEGIVPAYKAVLDITGNYNEIIYFLTAIEYARPVMRVEDMRIELASEARMSREESINQKGNLKATLNVALFAKK